MLLISSHLRLILILLLDLILSRILNALRLILERLKLLEKLADGIALKEVTVRRAEFLIVF